MSDDKKLIYILIGSGKKPLASYSEFMGEFIQTCQQTLGQVTPNSSVAINYGDYMIYYMDENNITYMLMTRTLFPKATAVGCIESLKKEFQDNLYGRDFSDTPEYGLNDELKEKLKMKFEYYNENPEVTSEAIETLKTELLKMKDQVFSAHIELQNRGEKIQEMTQKAEQLQLASESYKQGAIKVRKAESKKKVWIFIGTTVAVLIIAYFIVCAVCQSFTFQC